MVCVWDRDMTPRRIDPRAVLLVEDNPDEEALALRALRKCGLVDRILVARDGVEALEMLHGPPSDAKNDVCGMLRVVFLDLRLPRIDGIEVLRRMRADSRTRTLPVVVLTSSQEEQDLARSYQHGANSYILKPVDFDRFCETLQFVASYWLSVNEMPDKLNGNGTTAGNGHSPQR